MTKTDLARLWREVNGSPRWPGDVDAFVNALLAAAPVAPAPPALRRDDGSLAAANAQALAVGVRDALKGL